MLQAPPLAVSSAELQPGPGEFIALCQNILLLEFEAVIMTQVYLHDFPLLSLWYHILACI